MEKKIFKNQQGLIFGLSQKSDGDMKIHKTEAMLKGNGNRHKFYDKIGVDSAKVISILCAHGKKITKVDASKAGVLVCDRDGLVTNIPGLVLSLSVADCAPVYLFDPRLRVISLIHSGWRGTVDNIVAVAVEKMLKDYGSRSQDIQAFVGPHIQLCHFEVGKEVAEKFDEKDVESRKGKLYVNLGKAIKRQLITMGLSRSNIRISKRCTYCETKFYSHRRDKFPRVKAGLAYLGMEF